MMNHIVFPTGSAQNHIIQVMGNMRMVEDIHILDSIIQVMKQSNSINL